VVMLDHHKESMPGGEPTLDDSPRWVSTHVVAAGDTAESPLACPAPHILIQPLNKSHQVHQVFQLL